ncbi:MAG: HU family DNA-binding protein [Rhodospirillaceae bacterium]|nr:HU family DNA-binding protein [Rhodospirillaceae bacterium]
MNRRGIAAYVTARTGLPREEAHAAVNAVIDCISEALLRGELVRVSRFGTFTVSTRAGGSGRDFQTGARGDILPTRRAVFRPGPHLRKGLNVAPRSRKRREDP